VFAALFSEYLSLGQANGRQRREGRWGLAEFAAMIDADAEDVEDWTLGRSTVPSIYLVRMAPVLFGPNLLGSPAWQEFLAAWRESRAAPATVFRQPSRSPRTTE
jgi:hypothetical protein